MNKNTEELYASQLDNQDPLASFRERFIIDDPNLIYLDGNSLGRLPKDTIPHLQNLVEEQWGKGLIEGWNKGWFEMPTVLGSRIAKLIGARDDEVVVCDTTSVNLFKLAAAALRYQAGKKVLLSDEFNFPTDLYVFQGVIDLLNDGHKLDLIRSEDSISISEENINNAITEDTALVALTQVAFKSAFMYDIQKVTELAHKQGALAMWDLCHSVGAVPLELNEWNVDLAVGCTYKYLNGGPGSPAFLYVRKDLQKELLPPIWGWFADKAPFAFNLDFTPADSISRYQISTPHILSMAGIEPALEIILEAGMDQLREKSIMQTDYLIYLAQELLIPLGFEIGSPLDSSQRGSHVSLRHPEAYRICRALIDPQPGDTNLKVIPDFRAPNNIRLGIAPLYTSFTDIHRALKRIKTIVEDGIFQNYSKEQLKVT
ncbi:MAG: kynureninase [Chloroflexota bacterium]|nr:MAG: kynureninase [Chloroflexota bacterium]